MPVNPVQTRRWRRLRRLILSREPLCRKCKAQGRVTAATDVDHILSRHKGGDIWAHSNLQPLCRECHQQKTDREAGKLAGVCLHGVPRDTTCPDCG